MNYLLIDIGNTKIKYALSVKGVVKKSFSIHYKKPLIGSYISKIIRKHETNINKIFVSSLDKRNNTVIKQISTSAKTIFVSSRTKLPIILDYEKSLGSDRICSAVAAFYKFSLQENILVIDMGTATTFNIISKGVFKGGMISPGIKTAAYALFHKTSLPEVNLSRNVSLINKTTKSAIRAGIVLQQSFFIRKAIEEYKIIYNNLFVIATGGGAMALGKELFNANVFEKNLVLEGLNIIAKFNDNF